MDDDQGFYSNLQLDDDDPQKVLAGILSPADAQTLAASPPIAPAVSGPGQSTPQTGSIATAPSQAQPRVGGPAMIPGVATKPENLVASNVAQPAPSSFGNRGGLRTIVKDNNGTPAGSPLSTFSSPTTLAAIPGFKSRAQRLPGTSTPTAVTPSQPTGTPSQQRWNRIVGNQARISPSQQQAAVINAGGPGAPLSSVGPTNMPDLGTQPLPNLGTQPLPTLGPAPRGTIAGDTAELNRLQNTGSGISQIKNPVGRGFARAADIAETILAPNIERITPGTVGNNERLQEIAQGRVNSDQAQQQAAAQLADTQGQTQYRQQQAAREAAQAQADTTRQPTPQEAADYNLDPNAFYRPSDIGKAAVQAAKNAATLKTHTGGQSHKLTADDAALVGAPALEGETISNDAWQKMVSGVQRNTQSGKNTAANNATRVQTTGMRDATSTGNSNRAHQPKGAGSAPKPIPAPVRDRIESQKSTALAKARADLDSGVSSMDEYKNTWQAIQDAYEERISAQTGTPVPHVDIRKNTDPNGNWIGRQQAATAQPQTQQPANRPAFITRKGSAVALGDPVNVNGRKGTVTGFNPTTGKAQVRWEAAK